MLKVGAHLLSMFFSEPHVGVRRWRLCLLDATLEEGAQVDLLGQYANGRMMSSPTRRLLHRLLGLLCLSSRCNGISALLPLAEVILILGSP